MKKEAVIVFFCTTKFGYKLIQSNEKWFRYDLVWKKSRKVGFLSANKMPLRQHEMMYVFKEKGGTYNPQKTEGKEYNKYRPTQNITTCDGAYGKIFKANHEQKVTDRHPTSIVEAEPKDLGEIKGGCYRGENGKPFKRMANDPTTSHPTTVLDFKNPGKSVHKTQKPVDLCEWLIKSYSNEGDLVMDFCMGSGTTGVACKNTGRSFIGVEKDPEIFKVAEKRLRALSN